MKGAGGLGERNPTLDPRLPSPPQPALSTSTELCPKEGCGVEIRQPFGDILARQSSI